MENAANIVFNNSIGFLCVRPPDEQKVIFSHDQIH